WGSSKSWAIPVRRHNHFERGEFACRSPVWTFRSKPRFEALRLPTDCGLHLLILTRKKFINLHLKNNCEGQGRAQRWRPREMLVTRRLGSISPAEKKCDFILRKPEPLAVNTQIVWKFVRGH